MHTEPLPATAVRRAPFRVPIRWPACAGACLMIVACGGSGGGGAPETAPETAAASDGQTTEVKAVQVAAGLRSPWSFAFLPDGRVLVAEKGGALRRVSPDGSVSAPLTGLPVVRTAGQGGLLDVVLSPTHDTDRTIFFSYAEPVGGGDGRTAVASAVLGESAVSDVRVIFRQASALPSGTHYGSRLVFDRSGYLFVTLGERGNAEQATNLQSTLGKVVRIRPDGTVPPDNPALAADAPAGGVAADAGSAHPAFAGAGVLPGIWSFGHRNPQGAALHPVTGELWISEHGPRGGDEINRIRRGRHYGWPRITYGRDYGTGLPMGDGTTAPDVESPAHYWVPVSIAPAGMTFYSGGKLPGWNGSLLVGALAGRALSRLEMRGDEVVGETLHLQSLGLRIRDVRQGPDGYPYFISDSGGLYRVERR